MWPLTALKAHIKAAGIYITLGNKFAPQSMLTSICVKFFFYWPNMRKVAFALVMK